MNKKIILLPALFLLFVSFSFAQTKTLVFPSIPPPGNIKLLPGYVHERQQGIDSAVGNISKKDGLIIIYDIGRMAGNRVASAYSTEKQNTVWLKTQEINNQKLTILYLKDGSIYASFADSYANFMSNVKTNEELTDFLLMIMTYGSADTLKNKETTKQK